jgi:hypothetical protein
MWLPSLEMLNAPLHPAGVVIGSGVPNTLPVSWSIATRHRFMLPPRSLAK